MDVQNQCTGCGSEPASYDGVYIPKSDGNGYYYLCSKCYNEYISEAIGLDYKHISFHPVTLTDANGEEHLFHIRTHLFGDELNMQAIEIKNKIPKGYEYSIHGDAECDLFILFSKLIERVRREIMRRHIEPSDIVTRYQITEDDTVRGYITCEDDSSGLIPLLVIDGKEIEWDEFGKMIMAYEGFHFKLEIFESNEER